LIIQVSDDIQGVFDVQIWVGYTIVDNSSRSWYSGRTWSDSNWPNSV